MWLEVYWVDMLLLIAYGIVLEITIEMHHTDEAATELGFTDPSKNLLFATNFNKNVIENQFSIEFWLSLTVLIATIRIAIALMPTE